MEKEQSEFNVNLEAYKFKYNKIGFDYKKLAQRILYKYDDFVEESDDEYRSIHKVNEKYSGVCMHVRCKKDFNNDHWKVKISFIINHEPWMIYDFLRMSYVDIDNKNSNGWDKKLIDRKIVSKLDDDHYIMHEIYKSFNSPYKISRFCSFEIVRKEQLLDNHKRYLIVWASITNFKKIPETTDKLRCILYPSGFEIRPCHNTKKKSYVSLRLHFTSESVNIVTADLLGECDELFQSMIRISKLLSNYKTQIVVATASKKASDVNRVCLIRI
eukprot:TRINITY_DN105_c0_g2_i1.p1 TRINITY_DN105_c0_g2~~TRINITY_DN105_c0_g2_i1.p1  ORF type:complete len:271 (+),score=75.09 TRINITY_DN105_c0_g2_i1:142-954(+)